MRVAPAFAPYVDQALRETARRLLSGRNAGAAKKLPPPLSLDPSNLAAVSGVTIYQGASSGTASLGVPLVGEAMARRSEAALMISARPSAS